MVGLCELSAMTKSTESAVSYDPLAHAADAPGQPAGERRVRSRPGTHRWQLLATSVKHRQLKLSKKRLLVEMKRWFIRRVSEPPPTEVTPGNLSHSRRLNPPQARCDLSTPESDMKRRLDSNFLAMKFDTQHALC